jgi:hypothetical protein
MCAIVLWVAHLPRRQLYYASSPAGSVISVTDRRVEKLSASYARKLHSGIAPGRPRTADQDYHYG